MGEKVCRGIRGATRADANTSEAILSATRDLLLQMIKDNDVRVDDVACAYFTTTPDLTAAFPATAARLLGGGWEDVALMGSQEIAVPKVMPSVIRTMVLINTEKRAKDLKRTYLKGTDRLLSGGVPTDGSAKA